MTQFTVGTPQLNTQVNAYDWPNFGYDLQGIRVNPTETTITTSNVSTLAIKWKSPFPITNKVTGSPVIVNGIAYVGTVQGFLVAFDITNGNTLWTFAARGPIYGSPTVQNGIAYFGSVNYPAGGLIGNYFYALNATDGSLIWENYLDKGADWVDPIVSNGKVFVSSALKEAVSGGFSAFDATTGATLWSIATPNGIWSTPTMDPTGTNLYVDTGNPCLDSGGGSCSGYAQDINPATGAIIWQYHVVDLSGDDDIPTTASYSSGKIYLNASTPNLRNQHSKISLKPDARLLDAEVHSAISRWKHIGSKNGIFYCLDATNGNVLQQYDTGKRGDSGIYSSPALYNGKVYFGGGDGHIHALNMSDFSLAWSFSSNRSFISSPVEANGIVYSGGGDSSVYAFDATTGAKLWSFKTGAAVFSSVTISNGVLYVSGSDGYFYAFSLGGV